jgi:ribosomal protein L11 methyltransferase
MSATARNWSAVRIEVAADSADEVAGRLAFGVRTLGVELRESGSDRVAVLLYVATHAAAAAAATRARGILRELPGEEVDAPGRVQVLEVSDGRWVERYQDALGPLPIGDRFVVIPDAGAPPAIASGRVSIVMVPGRAFGTGEHPTTRMCVSELEAHVGRGSLWLDLGTGSGILALVAAHCGARRVVALDVDPDAVEVARRWVARNAMSDRVEVRHAGAESCRGAGFDGVVANVSTSYFEGCGLELLRALRPRGVLLASGFPVEDLAAVRRALVQAGFSERSSRAESGWGFLAMLAATGEDA